VVAFAGEVSAAPPAPSRAASEILLAVVAEKTGYPVEMLALDMSLDADLGIDSIKRVEILSALAERIPGAPAAKPEDLGRFPTLRDVVAFLGGGEAPAPPATAPTAVPAPPVPAAQAPAAAS